MQISLVCPGVIDQTQFVYAPLPLTLASHANADYTLTVTAKDVLGTVIPCTPCTATRVTMKPDWISTWECSGDQFEVGVTVPSGTAKGLRELEWRFDEILVAQRAVVIDYRLLFLSGSHITFFVILISSSRAVVFLPHYLIQLMHLSQTHSLRRTHHSPLLRH